MYSYNTRLLGLISAFILLVFLANVPLFAQVKSSYLTPSAGQSPEPMKKLLKPQDVTGFWVLENTLPQLPNSTPEYADILKEAQKITQDTQGKLSFWIQSNGIVEVEDRQEQTLIVGSWRLQNNVLWIKPTDKAEEKPIAIALKQGRLEMLNENRLNKGISLLMYFAKKEKK